MRSLRRQCKASTSPGHGAVREDRDQVGIEPHSFPDRDLNPIQELA